MNFWPSWTEVLTCTQLEHKLQLDLWPYCPQVHLTFSQFGKKYIFLFNLVAICDKVITSDHVGCRFTSYLIGTKLIPQLLQNVCRSIFIFNFDTECVKVKLPDKLSKSYNIVFFQLRLKLGQSCLVLHFGPFWSEVI